MDVAKKIQDAGLILGGLGVIGFIGIVWLMIYGNLSGNLGFASQTTTFTNEGGYGINGTTFTLRNGTITPGFESLSVASVVNATGGGTIGTANYTVDATAGTIVGSAARLPFNWTQANITYTVTFKAAGERNSEAVIDNISTGFLTFFSFSNTFFTIAAIVLLIFMLVGLLAIVMTIAQGGKGKGGSGFAGY